MNEDLIRRSDAISEMEQRYQDILRIFKRKVKDGERAIVLDMIGCIKSLPSAQPEPKTGYLHLLDECANAGYYCSECHKKIVKEGWSKTVKKINFCPNCGVDLRGDKHE